MESPAKSKIPVVEEHVDHLTTVIKAVAIIIFLPLPLFLVFGAKTFLWMGVIVMAVALVRFINSPVQVQRATVARPDPIAATVRMPQQPPGNNVVSGPPR